MIFNKNLTKLSVITNEELNQLQDHQVNLNAAITTYNKVFFNVFKQLDVYNEVIEPDFNQLHELNVTIQSLLNIKELIKELNSDNNES